MCGDTCAASPSMARFPGNSARVDPNRIVELDQSMESTGHLVAPTTHLLEYTQVVMAAKMEGTGGASSEGDAEPRRCQRPTEARSHVLMAGCLRGDVERVHEVLSAGGAPRRSQSVAGEAWALVSALLWRAIVDPMLSVRFAEASVPHE